MYKNYLIIAWRSLRKHFTYSLINILGLGLGFATFILLATWIRHELSYDQFHEKSGRIYRASLEYGFGGQVSKTSVSPTALLPALQKNFAEIESGVRLYNATSWNSYVIRKGDKLFQEDGFFYADSGFFDVFSFRLLHGNSKSALANPNSVVLTEQTAKKYFGEENPIGQVIQINNRGDYTITGVMQDVPSNSHIQFDFVASFSSLEASRSQIWWSANYQTYVAILPSADIHFISEKTTELVKSELSDQLSNPGDYVKYNFVPITDIHLKSDVGESGVTGSIQYVYLFSAIALLVVIIACINYINLATARAADRAKEVGIRKVVGAVRKQLFFQFIGESIIITLISFAVAFLLAQLSLTAFNALTEKSFRPADLVEPQFLSGCLIGAVIIAMIAGIYPALAITSFKPMSILRGNFRSSAKGIWLRQTLVVFQFSVSIILIVGTLIILQQIGYIQDKRLGYDKENILILPLDRKTKEVYGQLKTELLRSGNIVSVARGSEAPTQIQGGYTVYKEGGDSEQGIITTGVAADEEYITSMNMKLTAGRNFTTADIETMKADTSHSSYAFVVNESAIKELLLPLEKAIGSKISLGGRKGEIIGVVNDFHFSSLHEKIGPLVLFNEEEQYSHIFVKVEAGHTQEGMEALKTACSTLLTHRPFEYKFLDEEYAAIYSSEQKVGNICIVFATLTIIIACLGLFGLVAFSASQKIKEIGIRKVLGASATSIVLLITKDYSRLLLLAIVIGLPIAYYIIENLWLITFVYRTTVGLFPFALASIICLLIAFGTASFQAIRAAMLDPVNTLRNE